MAKCTGPRMVSGVAHFFAFAGFVCYVAGWAMNLGYFNELASLAAGEAEVTVNGGENGDGSDLQAEAENLGNNLGDNFLASMNDHTSAGFTDYLFIISGFLALLIKLLQNCIKNRWFGIMTIFFMCASIAMAGFVAGPKGQSFITCVTEEADAGQNSTELTATEKQLADCVQGENNINIALAFFGSTIYIICITFCTCMMFFEAQTNLNKIAPTASSAKQNEVWA